MPTPQELLKQYFGFDEFREGQAEAIERVLNGQHTLLVMPTGSGKSLTYQLPALMQPGLTLVISPLIALMQDQVDGLTEGGIPATYINSMLPTHEVNRRMRAVLEGHVRLLYIAPERLRNRQFTSSLARTKIGLLAVDEAHCISQWGHDFRPDYLQIGPTWEAMGRPTLLATTATATPTVQKDILTLFGLEGIQPIITGFNRPNLTFRVISTPDIRTKLQALQAHLSRMEGSAIVYCATRRSTDEVTNFIQEVLGRPAGAYHAGLDRDARYRVQNDFMNDRLKIVVATNAFGMGIDKADVRTVIHYNMPGTVEAYYQEAGRAGRDGHPAECVLLFAPDDQRLQEWLISGDTPTSDDLHQVYTRLTQAANGDEVYFTQQELAQMTGLHPVKIRVTLSELEQAGAIYHLGDEGGYGRWKILPPAKGAVSERARAIHERCQIRLNLLQAILEYVYLNRCRRQFLLNYFGDTSPPRSPRCCDNHTADRVEDLPKAVTPQEWYPLIVLETIRSLADRPVGRSRLAQLLNGSRAKPMQQFGYDRHKFYGKLEMLSQNDITGLIDALIAARYLQLTGGELPVLYLTELGQKALEARAALPLAVPALAPQSGEAVEQWQKRPDRSDTTLETLALFQGGLSPAEIAAQRGLTETTVYNHLARLIGAGQVELGQVIPPEVEAQIMGAIQILGRVTALSPIKALLPDEISFEQIRCVLASRPDLRAEAAERPGAEERPERRVVTLGESGDPAHVPELITALAHEDGNVRRLATSALGKLGDRRAVEPLLDRLAGELKPQVRQYLIKALGRLGDPLAISRLEEIANDPAETDYNRKSAQAALEYLAKVSSEPAPQPEPAMDAIATSGGTAPDKTTQPPRAEPPSETSTTSQASPSETSLAPDSLVLQAVAKLGGTLGRTGLAQFLTGSKAAWLEPFTGHSAYGRLSYLPQRAVMDIIDALITEGRLRQTGGFRPKVILPDPQLHPTQSQPVNDPESPLSRPKPRPEPVEGPRPEPCPEPVEGLRPEVSPAPVPGTGEPVEEPVEGLRPEPVEGNDPALLETLRRWRTEQARLQKIPPYLIFSNKVLEAIAAQQPTSLAALGAINGIGPAKLEQYGDAVLALLSGETGQLTGEAAEPAPAAAPPVPSAPPQKPAPTVPSQKSAPARPAKKEPDLAQAILQVVTDLDGLISPEGLAELLVAGPNDIVSFSDHDLCGRFRDKVDPAQVQAQIQELVEKKEIGLSRFGRLVLP